MIEADQLAFARDQVESAFQDTVVITTSAMTDDGEGGRTSGVTTEIYNGTGTLKRMTRGDESIIADRLQGREGYTLKVPYSVDPSTVGTATVNDEDYEILSAFGGEVRSTHTRLMLAKLT